MKKKRLTFMTILLSFMTLLGSSAAVGAVETVPNTANITHAISIPAISVISRKGKGVTKVSWGKVSGASGYEIQYGTDKDYSGAKTLQAAKGSATSKSIKGLSAKKDTYIRIDRIDVREIPLDGAETGFQVRF